MSLFSIASKKLKNYLSKEEVELRRLVKIPRYTPCKTTLLDGIELADSLSFVAGYEEIFRRENYKVEFGKQKPFIIDCGSNIGLSIIYFKNYFPDATIIGFEPDPSIFQILKRNTQRFNHVMLYNKALGAEKKKLNFISEGGFSGRVKEDATGSNVIEVNIEPLSTYIDRDIDLLKIDIEGAEYFSSIASQKEKKSGPGTVSSSSIIPSSTFSKNQVIELLTALPQPRFSCRKRVFTSQAQSIFLIT